MAYNEFIEKVTEQDNRNVFGTVEEEIKVSLPDSMTLFYQKANPIDVEVRLNDLTSIKFFRFEGLYSIQEEYTLEENCIVFASREGDPIFIQKEKVYTTSHGNNKNLEKEKYADSFNEFIEWLLKQI